MNKYRIVEGQYLGAISKKFRKEYIVERKVLGLWWVEIESFDEIELAEEFIRYEIESPKVLKEYS